MPRSPNETVHFTCRLEPIYREKMAWIAGCLGGISEAEALRRAITHYKDFLSSLPEFKDSPFLENRKIPGK